jgi:hypothetical protein
LLVSWLSLRYWRWRRNIHRKSWPVSKSYGVTAGNTIIYIISIFVKYRNFLFWDYLNILSKCTVYTETKFRIKEMTNP